MGENIRLASAFMSQPGPQSPDLCEIEIHSIGQFLRPPIDDIGLLPLNDFLTEIRLGQSHHGQPIRSLVQNRSAHGPADYLRNPRRRASRDHHLSQRSLRPSGNRSRSSRKPGASFRTCVWRFKRIGRPTAGRDRRAIALSTGGPDEIVEMLLQRHINLIDHAQRSCISPTRKFSRRLMFYAQLVAGPRAIGADVSPGVGWTEDLDRGNVCAVCTPDWKAGYLREFSPRARGQGADDAAAEIRILAMRPRAPPAGR